LHVPLLHAPRTVPASRHLHCKTTPRRQIY
jgi:hypothetical protein